MIEVTQVFVPAADCQGCGTDATVTIRIGLDYRHLVGVSPLLRLCETCSADLVEKLS